MLTMRSLGLAIKILRTDAGESRESLAGIFGKLAHAGENGGGPNTLTTASRRLVQMWETGEQFPTMRQTVRLAEHFDMKASELIALGEEE